jgi:tRNA threonylcarbamoyladenosine biosynthesis protein TsaB
MRSEKLNLLAVDTSTRTIGLAIYDGIHVRSETIWTSQDHHTVELAPAVAEMLEKTRLTVADLGAIGVAIGPGSFTGLRIGLALAKGLAFSLNIPLVGIPTLDALAAAQPLADIPMAAVLLAGRGRLAVSWYHATDGAWQPSSQIEVLTPDELLERIQSPQDNNSATLVCGELGEEERRLLGYGRMGTPSKAKFPERKKIILASPALCLRRPSFLAELAWRRWQAGETNDPASLAPIYLHYNAPIPG